MISTHVLDASAGTPAAGVRVTLEIRAGETWISCGSGITDADGRVRELHGPGPAFIAGRYRAGFDTGTYFAARGLSAFHPAVSVEFLVTNASEHHHVPLLLGPFGYTTYRGS